MVARKPVWPGVKLLLKGCGSPTELMAEIQIPVSRQVAIAHVNYFCVVFWATVCKTVRPMLSDRCLPVLSCLSRWCIVPNSWLAQDATLSNTVCPADCVRWRPISPPNKGAQHPLLFGPCALWPNGCMDQDATWYGCRPRPGHVTLDGT